MITLPAPHPLEFLLKIYINNHNCDRWANVIICIRFLIKNNDINILGGMVISYNCLTTHIIFLCFRLDPQVPYFLNFPPDTTIKLHKKFMRTVF